MKKKILYIDMDGVLVDFDSGVNKAKQNDLEINNDNIDNSDRLFSLMDPIPGALDAFKKLSEKYDVYILSTAPWDNSSAWQDKVEWVKKYLGEYAFKRLILTHNKHLNKGDYLIDDRLKNGASEFEGEHIHFGTSKWPNWKVVLDYLL